MPSCCMFGCNNSFKWNIIHGSEFWFHRAPDKCKYPDKYRDWVLASKRINYAPYDDVKKVNNAHVCSAHFYESDYNEQSLANYRKALEDGKKPERGPRLKFDTVPKFNLSKEKAVRSVVLKRRIFEAECTVSTNKKLKQCDNGGATEQNVTTKEDSTGQSSLQQHSIISLESSNNLNGSSRHHVDIMACNEAAAAAVTVGVMEDTSDAAGAAVV